MARQKFVHFVPRPKPRKRPGRHSKNLNKSKKRSYKKYNRQGRWQTSHNLIYYPCNSNHPIMEDLNYILLITNKE